MAADYLALPRRLTAPQLDHLTQAVHLVPLRSFPPWVPTVPMCSRAGHACQHRGRRGVRCLGQRHLRSALAPLADLPVDWKRFDG